MNKTYVTIISFLSIGAFLVLLFGFSWTIHNQLSKKESTVRQQTQVEGIVNEKEGKTIVALGDSLTRGTGDEEGKGYIGYLVEELEEKTDEKLTLHNYGVKGYRSDQLLTQVKGETIQNQIKDADFILMTIGGNDLFQGGQTLVSPKQDEISVIKDQYVKNLKETIDMIKSINQDAVIFLVGLYNPFIDLEDAATTTAVVRDWNYSTNQLLDQYPNSVFVPTFDLFQLKVNDYLFSDKFHPNSKGYQLIAERVASLITW
ncbi:SGNH/GDSL hydrolase family protein [Robertmurraya sp. P23]|uniref:SGNH/GDSL hydrolase family protein n=1 Tax=Robertmurraya sp. P23 TaxID=3436931 RepID=UPI003D9687DF